LAAGGWLTLFVITNKANLSDGGVGSKERNIITNLNLRGLINDKSLDGHSGKTSELAKSKRGDHGKSTEHNWTTLEAISKQTWYGEFLRNNSVGTNVSIEVLMPRAH